ncbi:MAG: hypothetical protein ABWY54_07510 [Glaciihabitans sp.]
MRWDDLFNDLEGQLESEHTSEDADLRAEEERLRLARLGLRDRLLSVHRSSRGPENRVLRLALGDGTHVSVTPSTFGRDWFAGELHGELRKDRPCVIPLESISSVAFTAGQVRASLDGPVEDEADRSLAARLGLGFLLRDLCRRRAPVTLQLRSLTLSGTLDRVGRDHCDLAVHDAGGVRRRSEVTEVRMVRFTDVIMVLL